MNEIRKLFGKTALEQNKKTKNTNVRFVLKHSRIVAYYVLNSKKSHILCSLENSYGKTTFYEEAHNPCTNDNEWIAYKYAKSVLETLHNEIKEMVKE